MNTNGDQGNLGGISPRQTLGTNNTERNTAVRPPVLVRLPDLSLDSHSELVSFADASVDGIEPIPDQNQSTDLLLNRGRKGRHRSQRTRIEKGQEAVRGNNAPRRLWTKATAVGFTCVVVALAYFTFLGSSERPAGDLSENSWAATDGNEADERDWNGLRTAEEHKQQPTNGDTEEKFERKLSTRENGLKYKNAGTDRRLSKRGGKKRRKHETSFTKLSPTADPSTDSDSHSEIHWQSASNSDESDRDRTTDIEQTPQQQVGLAANSNSVRDVKNGMNAPALTAQFEPTEHGRTMTNRPNESPTNTAVAESATTEVGGNEQIVHRPGRDQRQASGRYATQQTNKNQHQELAHESVRRPSLPTASYPVTGESRAATSPPPSSAYPQTDLRYWNHSGPVTTRGPMTGNEIGEPARPIGPPQLQTARRPGSARLTRTIEDPRIERPNNQRQSGVYPGIR